MGVTRMRGARYSNLIFLSIAALALAACSEQIESRVHVSSRPLAAIAFQWDVGGDSGDLDLDGVLDTVLIPVGTRELCVLRGGQSSSGTFRIDLSGALADDLSVVRVADADGDGSSDLIVGTYGGEIAVVFGPVEEGRVREIQKVDLGRTVVRDLLPRGGTDARLTEILVAARDQNKISRLSIGTDRAIQVDEHSFASIQSPVSMARLEAGRDGQVRVAICSLRGGVTLVEWPTDREVQSTPSSTPIDVGPMPMKLVASDLDGDSALELIGSSAFHEAKHAFIVSPSGDRDNDGDSVRFIAFGPRAPNDHLVADLDHDGDADLVLAFGLEHQIEVLFNDGKGRFPERERVVIGFESVVGALAIADPDGDGLVNLIVGCETDSHVVELSRVD